MSRIIFFHVMLSLMLNLMLNHYHGDVPSTWFTLAQELFRSELIVILLLTDDNCAAADVHDPIRTLTGFFIWITVAPAVASNMIFE